MNMTRFSAAVWLLLCLGGIASAATAPVGMTPSASNVQLPAARLNFGVDTPLLTSRAPTINDATASGYVSGSLWRQAGNNAVYTYTNGAWGLTAPYAVLPGSASAATPAVEYGTCQLVAGYSGPVVHVVKADGTTGTDIGFITGTGIFDWATFNTFNADQSTASFTASLSTTTLTVTGTPVGVLKVNQQVQGAGIAANTFIIALGSGTGGAGTYTVNISQTLASEAMTSGPAPVRVSKAYDQQGGGANGDAVQAAFLSMPLLTGFNRIGQCPTITGEASQLAAAGLPTNPLFLTIPAAVALTKNSLAAAMMVRDATNGRPFGTFLQIGVGGSDAIQLMSNQTITQSFGASVAFSGNVGTGAVPLSPEVLTFSSPSTGSWSLISGQNTALTGAAFGAVALTGGVIGDVTTAIASHSVATFNGGEWAAVLLYSTPFSTTDRAAVTAALHQRFETSPQTQDTIVFDVESNTQGYGPYPYFGYVRQLADVFAGRLRVINDGYAGLTSAQSVSRFAASVSPIYNANRKNNIYFIWPGANAIWNSGATAAAEYANICCSPTTSLVGLAKAQNWTVIVAGEVDRSGTGAQLTQLALLDGMITAGAQSGGYTVCPVGQNPLIGSGTPGQASNQLYFADGAHMTLLGDTIAAQICAPVISAVLK